VLEVDGGFSGGWGEFGGVICGMIRGGRCSLSISSVVL